MAKFGEIEWDENNSFDKKKTDTKDMWMRLEDGPNRIRVVTKAHQYIVHKGVKKASDLNPKSLGQKIDCSNPDTKGTCPACDLGLKAGQRWYLGVIDLKHNVYKILDISWQVYSAIKGLAQQTDVWGDPTKYDIIITVNKNGSPYYTVSPVPHKPLSPDAQNAKDKADFTELKRKATPPTPEQVAKRLARVLEGEAPFIPPAKEKADKKTAAPASKSTKATTPDVVVNEQDEDIFPEYNADAESAA
jgi:hypothetical protein